MQRHARVVYVVLVAAGAAALAPAPAVAQGGWDPERVYASRPELDSLARRLELAAESPAYSTILRAQAAEEATGVRERLRDGDFRVGDRVVMRVEREATFSDSFVVEEGPAIRLPTVGRVELAGVLRAELEEHLTRELAVYVRDPVLQARTTIRISVVGAVGRPGFYAVQSQLLVTDVLAHAGQIAGNADLGKIRIEREGRALWDNEALAPEIIIGRTLDQLGVQAGDRIVVGRSTGLMARLQSSSYFFYLLIGLPPAIISLIALIT